MAYAIFNESKSAPLYFGGSSGKDQTGTDQVNGNVHSNSNIDIDTTGQVDITGDVTLDGTIQNQGDANIIGNIDYKSYIDLSDLFSQQFISKFITEAKNNSTYYDQNIVFGANGSNLTDGSKIISGPIYVDGNVTIQANGSISAPNTAIYATGTITINSNGSGTIGGGDSNGDVSFALYSGSGITIENNGRVTLDGLVYAPNEGSQIVTHNHGKFKVNGSIVGYNVDLEGCDTIVTYEPTVPGFPYAPESQIAYLVK